VTASGALTGADATSTPQLFANLATTARRTVPAVVNHYNIQQAFDVYAQPDGRDLGSVANDIDRLVTEMTPKLPRGSTITVRGQVQNMRSSLPRAHRRHFRGAGARVHHSHGQLSNVSRPTRDHHCAAGGVGGRAVGVVHHAHDVQRTVADGDDQALGVATSNSVLLITLRDDSRRGGFTRMTRRSRPGSRDSVPCS